MDYNRNFNDGDYKNNLINAVRSQMRNRNMSSDNLLTEAYKETTTPDTNTDMYDEQSNIKKSKTPADEILSNIVQPAKDVDDGPVYNTHEDLYDKAEQKLNELYERSEHPIVDTTELIPDTTSDNVSKDPEKSEDDVVKNEEPELKDETDVLKPEMDPDYLSENEIKSLIEDIYEEETDLSDIDHLDFIPETDEAGKNMDEINVEPEDPQIPEIAGTDDQDTDFNNSEADDVIDAFENDAFEDLDENIGYDEDELNRICDNLINESKEENLISSLFNESEDNSESIVNDEELRALIENDANTDELTDQQKTQIDNDMKESYLNEDITFEQLLNNELNI